MAEDIIVEVAFAQPDKQVIIPVRLNEGSTVQQAIDESKVLECYPEIDLATMKVGIFAKHCNLDYIVEQGDRVEIYRPLLQSPMDARRHRAVK